MQVLKDNRVVAMIARQYAAGMEALNSQPIGGLSECGGASESRERESSETEGMMEAQGPVRREVRGSPCLFRFHFALARIG